MTYPIESIFQRLDKQLSGRLSRPGDKRYAAATAIWAKPVGPMPRALPKLDSQSIDVFIRAMASAASPGCAIITHEFRGAASRVPAAATAFGLRRDHVLVEILASFTDRSEPRDEHWHQRWAQATRRAFDAMALPGDTRTSSPAARWTRGKELRRQCRATHQGQAALRSRQYLQLSHSAAGPSARLGRRIGVLDRDRKTWAATRLRRRRHFRRHDRCCPCTRPRYGLVR